MILEHLLKKSGRVFLTAAMGATVAVAVSSTEAAALPFEGRTFGCSVPSAHLQDDPSGGLGVERANALIVTPDSGSVPTQGSLAVFTTVGFDSGQMRCILYSQRLNELNREAYSDWVFGVGRTEADLPGICFMPPGGSCGRMFPGVADGSLPGARGPYNSFEVFPLAKHRTSVADALTALTTGVTAYTTAHPIRD